jgi:hypothetical protein
MIGISSEVFFEETLVPFKVSLYHLSSAPYAVWTITSPSITWQKSGLFRGG